MLTAAATHDGAIVDVTACAAHGCSPAVWHRTGLDERQTALFLELGQRLVGQAPGSVPRVRKEPKVRSWAKRPS